MTIPRYFLPPDYGDGDNGWGGQNDYAIYGQLRVPLRESIVRNYNARMFGARGDGVTDDSNAIAAARSAAAGGIGMGKVTYPAGIYITQPLTLFNNVIDEGDGFGVSILKLKSGSNADLFSGGLANTALINLAGTQGTGSSAGIVRWSLRNLTLDGNRAGQSSGTSYPLRVYGYGYILENVEIREGYSGGILADYYGPFAPQPDPVFEATWLNVVVHDNNGIGVECGGPHDSRWSNVLVHDNQSTNIHIAPNYGGLQVNNTHGWDANISDANGVCWLVEASIYASNCEAEGSNTGQLVILADGVIWTGGAVYAGAHSGFGIQLGQQAGATPYTNSVLQSGGLTTAKAVSGYMVTTPVQNIGHTNGGVWFNSDSGGFIESRITAAVSSNNAYTGTIGQKTTALLNMQGYTNFPNQLIHLGEGHSGQGGPFVRGMAAAIDPGTGGTITTNLSSKILLNPAAAETGVILSTTGAFDGAEVTLINIAAFGGGKDITFAAIGTSHVSGSLTLAAGTSATFHFYVLTGFWHRNT